MIPQSTRAVLYGRRSNTTQLAPNDEVLPRQLAACRIYAEDHGWIVVQEYQDDGVGPLGERPDLRRMIADAETEPRPFDVVLTTDITRVARGADQWADIKRGLDAAGVQVVFLVAV